MGYGPNMSGGDTVFSLSLLDHRKANNGWVSPLRDDLPIDIDPKVYWAKGQP